MKNDTHKYQICSKHYSVNDVMSMAQIEDLEVLSIKIYDKEINQIIVYDTQNHKCFFNDKCEKFNPEEIDVDYDNFETVIYKGKFPNRVNKEKSSSQLPL